MYMYSTPIL